MSRARLTPAPEMLALKLRLSIDTHIDPLMLAEWVRANLDWLRPDFVASGESETHQRVENCPAIWLRTQFKHRQVPA